MNNFQKSKFLQVAIEAIQAAEKIILKYYESGVRATLKPDQSPVTIADQEAENSIIETIRATFPDHGFLGEETGENITDSKYTWIIDSIDGTRNFLRQVPLFGTLIALKEHDEIILGISNLPALKDCIYAEKGKGAYRGDMRLSVSKKSNLQEAYLSYGGLKHFEKQDLLKNILSLINTSGRERGFGDSWPYHLLAEGKIDIVVDPWVKAWDVAPAKIIIEEAGGKFSDKNGKSFGEGAFTAVATNGLLHEQVLRYIGG